MEHLCIACAMKRQDLRYVLCSRSVGTLCEACKKITTTYEWERQCGRRPAGLSIPARRLA